MKKLVYVEYGAGNTHVIQFYHPLSVWIIIHQRHRMRHKNVSTNRAFIESLNTLKFWGSEVRYLEVVPCKKIVRLMKMTL
jgi:hypothetical protein